MRLPEAANRWKSDGRTIELDLNDPALVLSGTPGDEPTAHRFAAWPRSNVWTVSTQHSGPMRIGGRTSEQDGTVTKLEQLLLHEFSHGCPLIMAREID